MKHILFVDDEPRLLEALERMLRPQRRDWRMSFVVGGEAALAAIEETFLPGRVRIDIVVTDMRMPGIDGAELLKNVRERHPDVIRMVLSGYFETESELRANALAHEFLSKPCPPDDLRKTIERYAVV
jgi:DNA-binding NtrC family response regulator